MSELPAGGDEQARAFDIRVDALSIFDRAEQNDRGVAHDLTADPPVAAADPPVETCRARTGGRD